MATTKEDILQWLRRGKEEGATHVLVVCDTFEHEDYPKFIKPEEDVDAIIQEYADGKHSMQRLMECYDLSQDFDTQLAQKRAWNHQKSTKLA